MILRDAQIQSITEARHQSFITRLMAHFELLWPDHVAALAPNYRLWIEDACNKAATYGLSTEQDVARYINLWFVWGARFERRPEHAWALEILLDGQRTSFIKAHQLSYETRERLARAEKEQENG